VADANRLRPRNTDVAKYLTADELAERLDVHPDTIRRWAADGTIPAQRLRPRGRWWFDEADVEAALRRGGMTAAAVAAGGE
jgi:excisionase family DNA binding protein